MLALHANLKKKACPTKNESRTFLRYRPEAHKSFGSYFKVQNTICSRLSLRFASRFTFRFGCSSKKRKKEEEAMFPIRFIVKDTAFLKFPDQSVAIFGCMVYQLALR